jgi:effector-binding domain-containing protein
MSTLDVAIKTTEPVRIAEAFGTAPGFGHENLAPLFHELVPRVLGQLNASQARPGIMIAWYEEPADDGSVIVHAGFDIGGQAIPEADAIQVVDLPKRKVATLIHRGPMDQIAQVYEALVGWTENSGYELAGRSRELYHEWNDERPELSVTELQLPIK